MIPGCDACKREICHNHGSVHVPGCWPCVLHRGIHEGFRCLCDRSVTPSNDDSHPNAD